MATYLGRNVNLALLIIIIGVVVALVGTTVYFQRSLQNRTQEYESTTDTLSACQTALSNYESKYAESLAKVNETTQDIRKYDQLYESKVGELKDTQTQLTTTANQLAFEKLQKEKFQQFYEQAAKANAQLNQTIAYQKSQIDSLSSQLASSNSALSSCRSCSSSHGYTC
jgi:chromosome segregation ATPase